MRTDPSMGSAHAHAGASDSAPPAPAGFRPPSAGRFDPHPLETVVMRLRAV
jgi:hypothetical protein